jgi:hypothetical protein
MRHLLALLIAAAVLTACAYQTLNGPGDPPRANADDQLGPFN